MRTLHRNLSPLANACLPPLPPSKSRLLSSRGHHALYFSHAVHLQARRRIVHCAALCCYRANTYRTRGAPSAPGPFLPQFTIISASPTIFHTPTFTSATLSTPVRDIKTGTRRINDAAAWRMVAPSGRAHINLHAVGYRHGVNSMYLALWRHLRRGASTC